MIKEISFKYVGMGYIAIVDDEKFETNGIYLEREKLLEKILKEYGIDLNKYKTKGNIMSNYIDYTVRVYPNGTRKWKLHGKLHREGGPAIEWSDGVKEWWFKGKRHREDGPAVVYPDNIKKWFLHGVQVAEEDLIGKSLVGKTVFTVQDFEVSQ